MSLHEQDRGRHIRDVVTVAGSPNTMRRLDLKDLDRDAVRFREAIEFLKGGLDGFDEAWVVGHKGDHAINLQNMGVVNDRLDVVHVHSTLGVNANIVIKPPEDSAGSYEGILTEMSPLLAEQILRVKTEGKKVVIYMPFPNMGLEHAIARAEASDHFLMTAPVPRFEAFQRIEHKIVFGQMMDELFKGTRFERNLIPWTFYSRHMDYRTLEEVLRSEGSIYMQRVLSAGGDGTVKVTSDDELKVLMSDEYWAMAADMGSVKASKGIEKAYPANGTGCIVPTPDGNCVVLVDPLSHKPVGLERMNAKQGSGVGNDWSVPFSQEIQSQYILMATAIGQRLYREHGYTGLFGPDGMIHEDQNGQVYSLTEVNSRWQGTTPYQTLNARMNGRLPLELIHYMVKLCTTSQGIDKQKLQQAWRIIGDPNEYNGRAVSEKGGFYIKIGGPKDRKVISQDLNGAWVVNPNGMTKVTGVEGLTPLHVYSRTMPDGSKIELPENHSIVWVKAPRLGETVGGELAPIGYIVGSGIQVFDADIPTTTAQGQSMYDAVTALLFK